jgi:hypothetical protein
MNPQHQYQHQEEEVVVNEAAVLAFLQVRPPNMDCNVWRRLRDINQHYMLAVTKGEGEVGETDVII